MAEDDDAGKTETLDTKKRQNKRNMREKRRATGVVALCSDMNSDETQELKDAAQNAALNENLEDQSPIEINLEDAPSGDAVLTEALDQIKQYQDAIQEWQNAYNQLSDEVSDLKTENERLVSENKKLKAEVDNFMVLLRRCGAKK